MMEDVNRLLPYVHEIKNGNILPTKGSDKKNRTIICVD